MVIPLILVEDLKFAYEGSSRWALEGISLAQDKGQLLAIMGPTGAGKSTLCKSFVGLVPSFQKGRYQGRIMVEGQPVSSRSVAENSSSVGIVFSDFKLQLFSTNVELEIAFGLENQGLPFECMHSRITEALTKVGLDVFRRRDPFSLSGGQAQRLAIATVLAQRPKVIVFDEPTTDLDPQGRVEFWSLAKQLRDEGTAILVVTNDAQEAKIADEVLIFKEGRLVKKGAPQEVFTAAPLLEELNIRPLLGSCLSQSLGLELGYCQDNNVLYESLREGGYDIDLGCYQELLRREAGNTKRGEVILSLKDIEFSYPQGEMVLQDLDLDVYEGEFLAIVGPNGSGKTTLVKHCNGLLAPYAGEVYFGKERIRTPRQRSRLALSVGYVFQNPDNQIFANTVKEEIDFGLENLGLDEAERAARAEAVMQLFGLWPEREADPFSLTKGERQLVALASSLAMQPRVLILDEPATGLDYRQQRLVLEHLRRLNGEGTTVIIVTHNLWIASEYASRIVALKEGRVDVSLSTRDFFSLANQERLAAHNLTLPEAVALGQLFGKTLLSVQELLFCLKKR